MDLLLDVDRHDWLCEVLFVLLVLALPDQLGVERGVARVPQCLRRHLVILHEVAQFVGRDIHSRVLVADGLNGARPLGTPAYRTLLPRLLRHGFLAPWLEKMR